MNAEMLIENGWLTQHRRLISSNFNDRPAGAAPELLVIHNISLPPGDYGNPYIDCLFTNCLDPTAHPYFAEIAQLKVSAHLLIVRTGEISQYVAFDKRAWHAGASCFAGRDNCNDFSIGIELEGTDTDPYSQNQYQSLAYITNLLLNTYASLSRDRIVGHSDISPGRKTDPGQAFDWGYYKSLLTLNDH